MGLDLTIRPTIIITAICDLNDDLIKQLSFGIEEEDIPHSLEKNANIDLLQAAFNAANASSLSVGIACDNDTFILQYKNLPLEKPFLTLQNVSALHKQEIKDFGSNAARLVKGIAFKEK